jgi:hypothetical protein
VRSQGLSNCAGSGTSGEPSWILKALLNNVINAMQHFTPHNAGCRRWDSLMVIRQTLQGRRHSDESLAKSREVLPKTASIRESLQGCARKSGHDGETNQCGHHVRRLASVQFSASRVDTGFENLMGTDRRAVDGFVAGLRGG